MAPRSSAGDLALAWFQMPLACSDGGAATGASKTKSIGSAMKRSAKTAVGLQTKPMSRPGMTVKLLANGSRTSYTNDDADRLAVLDLGNSGFRQFSVDLYDNAVTFASI